MTFPKYSLVESSAAFVISEVKKSEDQGEKTTFWGEGIDVGEGDKEGCGVGMVVEIGEVDGVVIGLGIGTPLSQIRFLPDFMQVNFLP